MTVDAEQVRRLEAITEWAHKLRDCLQPILDKHGDRVHFRPASTGVAMVGLLPERPQRGKGGFTNLERLARDFESLFAAHCHDIDHGRVTGEKALQSFLIRNAYTHGRRMQVLNKASKETSTPVELHFVTDEISLPTEPTGKIVCDLLALRRDGGRCTPVLLELKDDRMLTRLVQQVDSYATLIDRHAGHFARLFSALLGEEVRFDGACEKWIIWPAAGDGPDPRAQELRALGIRVVSYHEEDGEYSMLVSVVL